jgi:hypothetical protein
MKLPLGLSSPIPSPILIASAVAIGLEAPSGPAKPAGPLVPTPVNVFPPPGLRIRNLTFGARFALSLQLITVPLTGEVRPPGIALPGGSDRFVAVHGMVQPGMFSDASLLRLLPIVTAP